jgi:hypothetical protein
VVQTNAFVEGVTCKIRREIEEIERFTGSESLSLCVNGVPVEIYFTRLPASSSSCILFHPGFWALLQPLLLALFYLGFELFFQTLLLAIIVPFRLEIFFQALLLAYGSIVCSGVHTAAMLVDELRRFI